MEQPVERLGRLVGLESMVGTQKIPVVVALVEALGTLVGLGSRLGWLGTGYVEW